MDFAQFNAQSEMIGEWQGEFKNQSIQHLDGVDFFSSLRFCDDPT